MREFYDIYRNDTLSKRGGGLKQILLLNELGHSLTKIHILNYWEHQYHLSYRHSLHRNERPLVEIIESCLS